MDKTPRILIVDDDNSFRVTMEGVLADEGYRVSSCANGMDAIETAKTGEFDIIFMDIKMPGINGVDAYIEIKKFSPKSAVIMMTGYRMEDLIEKAKAHGVYAILNKPFEMSYIIYLIDKILKPVILITDDNFSDREIIKGILEEKGYGVDVCQSGRETIERVKRNNIDIIFLDVKMPELDGVATFERIHEINPNISVVMITGYSVDEMLEQAIKKGAYSYIYKPIDINKIIEIINKIRHIV